VIFGTKFCVPHPGLVMGKGGSDRPSWVRLSGVGVEFAGAVAGLALVGYWIDSKYDSRPWGVLIGAALGLIGGTYNLIRESLAAFREEKDRGRDD